MADSSLFIASRAALPWRKRHTQTLADYMTNGERLEILRTVSISKLFADEQWQERGISISPDARIAEMKRFVALFVEWLGQQLNGQKTPDSKLVGEQFMRIYDDLAYMDSEERLMIQDVMEGMCRSAEISYS